MFPFCKHALCDKGDGQNLLIKPSTGESERHTHTPNYVSPVWALRGNGVMYESEWLFGRRRMSRHLSLKSGVVFIFRGGYFSLSNLLWLSLRTQKRNVITTPLCISTFLFHLGVSLFFCVGQTGGGSQRDGERRGRRSEKGDAPIRTISSTRSFLVHRNSLPCCQKKLKRIMWEK